MTQTPFPNSSPSNSPDADSLMAAESRSSRALMRWRSSALPFSPLRSRIVTMRACSPAAVAILADQWKPIEKTKNISRSGEHLAIRIALGQEVYQTGTCDDACLRQLAPQSCSPASSSWHNLIHDSSTFSLA